MIGMMANQDIKPYLVFKTFCKIWEMSLNE